MKKIFTTVAALLISVGFLTAQEISVAKASIAKVERTCVVGKYAMSTDVIEEALADKLKQSGLSKGSRVKGGFRVYQGVSIPEISSDKIDLYTSVEGKKTKATVYIIASRGYDNFFTPAIDSAEINAIKAYLQSMLINVNIAQIKVDIADQAKVVKDADKANESAIKTGKNLIEEQKSLENKIVENKKSQEANVTAQQEAAEKLKAQEASLSELKSKLQMMLKK